METKATHIKAKVNPVKGVTYLTFSKGVFTFASYIIYVGLSRILNTEQFGTFGVISGLIGIINTILVISTMQAVSKFISADKSLAEAVKRKALKLQMILGLSTVSLCYFFSPVIAKALKDTSLINLIRLSLAISLFYSLYSVFVGYLNGLKKFKSQALIDIVYSVLKVILILGISFLFGSVFGAIAGWVLASFLVLIFAFLLTGFNTKKAAGRISAATIFRFQIWIILLAGIINLLMNLDLFLLKSLSPLAISKLNSGYYTAILTIARLPYVGIISVSYVLFPFISELTAINDVKKTALYIKEAMRYTFMALIIAAVLISSNAKNLLLLIYPSRYAIGSVGLSIVAFGVIFFSLFVIATTIISGSGRPRHSVIIGFILLALDFILNLALIPRYGITGASLATTSAMVGGFIICSLYFRNRFHVFIPLDSFIKVSIAGLCIYAISILFPARGFLLVIKIMLLSAFYVGLLFLLKGISGKDFDYFISRLRKPKTLPIEEYQEGQIV